MDALRIDGSYGEGGGQVLRTAVSLSAITKRPVEVVGIRTRRKNPGLAAQHLTAVEAISKICNGQLSGAEIGSTRMEFHPSDIKGGRYTFDIGTAGSVTLVLQTLILPAIRADGRCVFEVVGGTDVAWSPSVQYLLHVFCEFLARMGVEVRIEILRRGFYPKGGGRVRATVEPCPRLKPLDLSDRGEFQRIDIWSVASEYLKSNRVAERQAEAARLKLGMDGVRMDAHYAPTFNPGSSIHLHAHYSNSKLGAGALGERGVRAEEVGEAAASDLLKEMSSGASVDVNMSDQLLPYMALAGNGSFTTRELSEHARTNMWLIEQFLRVKFKVEERDGLWLVSV